MLPAMDSAPVSATAAQPLALRWQWSRLSGLTPEELYTVLAVRQCIFNVEQRCTFQDADGNDLHAWHLLGWSSAPTSDLVAYLRVVDAGRRYADPSIGRVLTAQPHRRTGLGRALMREGIARTLSAWPGRAIRLAAQQHLEVFYGSLGFVTVSAPYLEDGIVHIDMVRDGA